MKTDRELPSEAECERAEDVLVDDRGKRDLAALREFLKLHLAALKHVDPPPVVYIPPGGGIVPTLQKLVDTYRLADWMARRG
jgi:hypothetical protein